MSIAPARRNLRAPQECHRSPGFEVTLLAGFRLFGPLHADAHGTPTEREIMWTEGYKHCTPPEYKKHLISYKNI